MIDAYEVGIQLLLQDDVSAGLAVINQGLADVDRAIAATSAGLAGLIQEANRANAAVAAGLTQKAAQHAKPIPPAETVLGETSSQRQAVARPESTQTEKAGVPPKSAEARPGDGAVASTPLPDAPSRKPEVTAEPTTLEVASPTRVQPVEAERHRQEPSGGNDFERTQSSAPAGPEQVRPTSVPPKVDAASPVERASSVTSSAPRPTHRGALTASIRRSGFSPETTKGGAQRRPEQSFASAPRDVGIAPWAGAEYRRSPNEPTRDDQRPSAPTAQSRERGDGGGGTVMLDGRLVGQWLADHMAQEASRPPAGTSFFDPRQTPAWNSSGAI